jgi:hypothetical protein
MLPKDGLVTTATKDEKTGDIHVQQQIKITTWIKESEDKAGNTQELKNKELLRVDKFRDGVAEAQQKANALAAKGFKDVETAKSQVQSRRENKCCSKPAKGS